MTMTTEKIKIQDGDTVIELSGADKDAFIVQREQDNVQFSLREAEYKAKQKAREDAIKKLAEVAGLTEEEIEAII
jgi:ABC-type transporter Mla maintaining outer membrane lipid asymmetry ATPase subunit MlaF